MANHSLAIVVDPHPDPRRRPSSLMLDQRQVVMDAEQAEILEELGERMLREHDSRATKVLALGLAYRYAAPQSELPSNVYPLITHSGGEWSRKVFRCNDIDESGGLA